MGSFAASVDLPERLRPFAQAGLALLFAPGGLSEWDTAATRANVDRRSTVTQDEAPALGHDQVDHDHPANQETATPSLAIATEKTTEPKDIVVNADRWPEPWRGLASRVRVAPRVIITYSSLADDMSGHADPARRHMLQAMLTYFAWPHGTTLFWPISFPTGYEPNGLFATDIFAAGVREFAVRHVVCLGEQPTARARTLFPQGESNRLNVIVLSAPEPEQLVGLLPHELHHALAHIKRINFS